MSRPVLWIGLTGPAFGGKDFCRRLLQANVTKGTAVVVARYAEPIYQMLRPLCPRAHSGMGKDAKERPREELGGLSVRQMAIAIGQGARQFDPMVWVNLHRAQAEAAIAAQLQQPQGEELGIRRVLVIVPDMRFETERAAFDEIQDRKVLIHVFAENAERSAMEGTDTERGLALHPHKDELFFNDHRLGVEEGARRFMHILADSEHLKWPNGIKDYVNEFIPLSEMVANQWQLQRDEEKAAWQLQELHPDPV